MRTETTIERLAAIVLEAAGARGTAAAARAVINVEGLRDLGFEIADGQRDDAEDWAAQMLAIASIMPWLPDTQPVAELLDEAVALVQSHPERFISAASLARGRMRGRWVSELIDALLSTALEAPAALPGDAVLAAGVLARALGQVDPTLLEHAEEALSDRLDWDTGVRAMRAQAATGWSAQASGGHADQQVRLRGDLVLSRYGGAVFVEWHGEGEPTLTFGSPAGTVDASRVASPGCALAWVLTDPLVTEAELTTGSAHFRVRIPR